MNTINEGLIAYENNIVLYSKEEKRILKIFDLNEEQLRQEIDNIMAEKITRPAEIFKNAVEKMFFSYKFFNLRQKINLADGNTLSIHDQEIFKRWKDYIVSCECYNNKIKKFIREKEEKRIQEEMYKQLNIFAVESSIKNTKKKHLP